MADGTRSLFESGDGLEQALHAKRQVARDEAVQFDLLIGYLLEWCDDPVATATCAAAGERVWQYGGSGTPEIPEFGVCEVASALGMSPNGAGIFVGDILDIRYRLPRLDAALHRGQVDAWRVRKVASATRQFTLVQAAEADRRLSAETLGDGTPMLCRVSMARLRQLLEQIRIRTRSKDADEETNDNRDRRHLRVGPVGGGLASLDGLVSAEDGERLLQRLDQVVDWLRALGDERSKDVLRSVALGYLTEPDSLDLLYDQVCRMRAHNDGGDAEPATDAPAETDEAGETHEDAEDGAEPAETAASKNAESPRQAADGEVPEAFRREQPRRRLPATTVYLHLDRESETWSMDGVGPISRAEAAEIVGHSHVTLKPVIDLPQNLTYTGYVAPPRLKEQTALQNAGYCTFPSCNRSARKADFDHITDYADGGPTSSRNGHRLCRYHHRAKTFTDWQVQSPAPGVWLWQSPAGRTYLVTGGTTTRLDQQHRRRTSAA